MGKIKAFLNWMNFWQLITAIYVIVVVVMSMYENVMHLLHGG